MQLTLAYHAKSLTDETVCFERCDLFTGPYQGNNTGLTPSGKYREIPLRIGQYHWFSLKVGRTWKEERELTSE